MRRVWSTVLMFCRLIKVVALTASPAGEKTLEATMNKIQALLDRLGADLVTPMETLPEVCCALYSCVR